MQLLKHHNRSNTFFKGEGGKQGLKKGASFWIQFYTLYHFVNALLYGVWSLLNNKVINNCISKALK